MDNGRQVEGVGEDVSLCSWVADVAVKRKERKGSGKLTILQVSLIASVGYYSTHKLLELQQYQLDKNSNIMMWSKFGKYQILVHKGQTHMAL